MVARGPARAHTSSSFAASTCRTPLRIVGNANGDTDIPARTASTRRRARLTAAMAVLSWSQSLLPMFAVRVGIMGNPRHGRPVGFTF